MRLKLNQAFVPGIGNVPDNVDDGNRVPNHNQPPTQEKKGFVHDFNITSFDHTLKNKPHHHKHLDKFYIYFILSLFFMIILIATENPNVFYIFIAFTIVFLILASIDFNHNIKVMISKVANELKQNKRGKSIHQLFQDPRFNSMSITDINQILYMFVVLTKEETHQYEMLNTMYYINHNNPKLLQFFDLMQVVIKRLNYSDDDLKHIRHHKKKLDHFDDFHKINAVIKLDPHTHVLPLYDFRLNKTPGNIAATSKDDITFGGTLIIITNNKRKVLGSFLEQVFLNFNSYDLPRQFYDQLQLFEKKAWEYFNNPSRYCSTGDGLGALDVSAKELFAIKDRNCK